MTRTEYTDTINKYAPRCGLYMMMITMMTIMTIMVITTMVYLAPRWFLLGVWVAISGLISLPRIPVFCSLFTVVMILTATKILLLSH